MIQNKKNLLGVVLLLCVSGLATSAMADVVFTEDFESMTAGQKLDDQNGWVVATGGNAGGIDIRDDSKAWDNYSGKWGYMNTGDSDGFYRKSIGVDLSSATELTIEFSFRASTATARSRFGLSYGDSPFLIFGTTSGTTKGQIGIQHVDSNDVWQTTELTGGDVLGDSELSDLMKVRLVLDVTNKLATMSYIDPSDTWQTPSHLENVSIDINPGTNDHTDPANWNNAYLRFQKIEDGTEDRTALDNLSISEVPEPATLSLLVLGGVAMLKRRKRK